MGSTQQSANRHFEPNCRDHGCKTNKGKTSRKGNFKDCPQRKGSTVQSDIAIFLRKSWTSDWSRFKNLFSAEGKPVAGKWRQTGHWQPEITNSESHSITSVGRGLRQPSDPALAQSRATFRVKSGCSWLHPGAFEFLQGWSFCSLQAPFPELGHLSDISPPFPQY